MSVMEERICSNPVEFWARRFISSIIYYRLYRKIFINTPWYTPGAIRFLKRNIDEKFKVFEYGTGQSSIWYSQRSYEYIGVENNSHWHDRISSKLNNDNAKIILAIKQETYIHSIDNFPDRYFDLISIDGRYRVDCLNTALPKLNENGFIVFDDSQRPKYKKIFEVMENWKIYFFDFGIIQTTIFTKRII